ncbi:DNA-binding transcriptional regulator of sugar metabolism, DeoR/GlpR family [Pseudarcicella hirudinis]|uniref:DNA-binding transcriptional regulator of sugar metabolism, DeoR/GlpR family n=1 Tax=Pseudarcicella hirudinis TaxID=1079859 RepID=A0A1I5YC10_9BACT|nr:DeoR/GlpR family DNA-binding transcription regulator [Pseudarcicella hirudinis]SFQ41752.1 DNA-binding transcriptional regulator of sugar metabolism, DeoR/GlpR family [Pseudarcicella hirudinis]
MLKKERQALIIKQINLHNKVLSSDLSLTLNVSEDTVRRDLHELAQENKIIKVHGGALSKSYNVTSQQSDTYAYEEKNIIALKTISLIKEGMTILTSGGTTMRAIARALPSNLKATFITMSPLIALELIEHPNLEVILLGGKLSNDSKISVGGEVVNRINEIKADLCILGINGLDFDGITDSDWEIVQVKKAIINASRVVIASTISEKLNSALRLKVCNLKEVDYLITELPSDSPTLLAFKEKVNHIL